LDYSTIVFRCLLRILTYLERQIMEIFGNVLDWALALFLFSLLLFVHEFGHFAMAKLTGVKVEEFGFGFPPKLKKVFTWRETDFTINAIPFGAFVRPRGEDDPTVEGGLAASSKRVRTAVLLGGVFANLLVAILAYTIAFKIAFPEGVILDSVVEGAPAAQAGLQAGDKILSIDGQKISNTQEVIQYIYDHLGTQIAVHYARNGVEADAQLTPRTSWPEGQGPSGLVLNMAYSGRHNLLEAFREGLYTMGDQVKLLLQLPGMILRGQSNLSIARPVGPVGILDVTEQIVGAARESNRWIFILNWIGMINLALAIGNILPIPALDGGRMLFVFLEWIRGKRINPDRERMVHAYTLLILLGLMLLITYLDIFFPVIPR
jgi:regulator of sigma E protease